LTSEASIRQANKVLDIRRVDVFVLGSNEKASNSNELKVTAVDVGVCSCKKAIQDVDGQMESIGRQVIPTLSTVGMNSDNPIDEKRTKVVVDGIWVLQFHVARINNGL